jgi:hypothetical protein
MSSNEQYESAEVVSFDEVMAIFKKNQAHRAATAKGFARVLRHMVEGDPASLRNRKPVPGIAGVSSVSPMQDEPEGQTFGVETKDGTTLWVTVSI